MESGHENDERTSSAPSKKVDTVFILFENDDDSVKTYTPFEAYEYVLNKSLDLPSSIPDAVLDHLHQETLKIIEAECDYNEIHPLRECANIFITKAKDSMQKRKYSLKSPTQENGLHESLPRECSHFSFHTHDSPPSTVFSGPRQRTQFPSAYIQEEAEKIIDNREEDFRKEFQPPHTNILTCCLLGGSYKLGEQQEVSDATSYATLAPVDIRICMNNPSSVTIVGEPKFKEIVPFKSKNKIITFWILTPTQNLALTCPAIVEHKWTKSYHVRWWTSIATGGVSDMLKYVKETSNTYNFPITIDAKSSCAINVSKILELRSKPTIKVTGEEA